MNRILLSDRSWRAYRALWLLLMMSLAVDVCAVVLESEWLQDTTATASQVVASDWLSFGSEAVGLLSLCGLLWLLRGGRGLTRGARLSAQLSLSVVALYTLSSKLPTLLFGPDGLQDGHWLDDALSAVADVLLPLQPAVLLVLLLMTAQLGGRVGRWCVAGAVALALTVPAVVAFVVNAVREEPVAWVSLVLGVVLVVLLFVPLVVLRLIVGGAETEE